MSLELVLRILKRGQEQGLLGPGDVVTHLEHARAHGSAANPVAGERWCDLGSGGGVPGLVIAMDYPDIQLVLLDRSQRRTEFLGEAVRDLGLSEHTVVLAGDASEVAHLKSHRHTYDGVVSRAFGPPASTAECGVGLLRLGGRLIVSEPPGADASRWPQEPLRQLGLVHCDIVGTVPSFAVFERTTTTVVEYPRPWKHIRKRPLY